MIKLKPLASSDREQFINASCNAMRAIRVNARAGCVTIEMV